MNQDGVLICKRVATAAFILLLLVGCAATSVTPVGNAHRQPPKSSEEVLVFSSEADVKKPFRVVGLISHTDPGKYQVLTLESAMPSLKAKAREVGANGIIIDEWHTLKSGIISTGISIRARAIVIEQP